MLTTLTQFITFYPDKFRDTFRNIPKVFKRFADHSADLITLYDLGIEIPFNGLNLHEMTLLARNHS